MRQVVLDTETTGLEPEQGHRIIEIGCVELVDRRFTERRFHCYLDPERDIDEGAFEVHGISAEFLAGKSKFADVAAELIEFVQGAELVIHNAAFDVAFIDAELKRLDGAHRPLSQYCTVTDTLALARETHPGQRNSLDALCSRYDVDNSARELHGALLDAEILADVYLAMTGGQTSLELAAPVVMRTGGVAQWSLANLARIGGGIKVVRASEAELSAHHARLESIHEASNGDCVWLLEESAPTAR